MSFRSILGMVLSIASLQAATSVYDFYLVSLDGTEVLLKTYQGKVLLIVNVANQTVYGDQLGKLETLNQQYGARGLVILGIPSDDFGKPTAATPDDWKAAVQKLHLSYPVFSKAPLTGKNQIPLYAFLTDEKLNAKTGGELAWNFIKYLVGRDGKPVARFDAGTQPDDPELMAAVEIALAEQPPAAKVSKEADR